MERKTMIGIVAGGLAVVGVGIGGYLHLTAPDPREAAEDAKLRSLAERVPGSGGAVTSGTSWDKPGSVPGAPVATPRPETRLKAPPSSKESRKEERRLVRERAIAEGRLDEFEAREKKAEERKAEKKAKREARRAEMKKKVDDRRKQIEAAREAGVPPPPPSGRKAVTN